jgi:hypothetical protein
VPVAKQVTALQCANSLYDHAITLVFVHCISCPCCYGSYIAAVASAAVQSALNDHLLLLCRLQVPGPVAATSQAAVQVAQAAQAVQQQAQSLHAAAEVHAQKAQEATSQVASLQATAHVSCWVPRGAALCLLGLVSALSWLLL